VRACQDFPIAGGTLTCRPLTPSRFADLEELFGPNGAVEGCWCMYWRRAGRHWSDNDENHRRLALRAGERPAPGLVGYTEGRAVGWVQVGRRSEFARIEQSRNLGPVDDLPAWCVNCFYIHRSVRRRGVAGALLDAAVVFARDRGAALLEGYPVDRAGASGGDLYTGTPGLFRRAGFVEVARRHPSRPIVRLEL
jgi:GNAT superfamily N-acetyltransferase